MQNPILVINGAHSTSAKALIALAGAGFALRLLSRRSEPPVGDSGLAADMRHFQVDARDAAQVEGALAEIASEERPIAGYVHMVGSLLLKPLHLTSPAEWDDVQNTNTRTAYLALHALLPVMVRQKGGSIVLVSSVAAAIGLANHEAIAAAKGALSALVPSLAATYAPHGIRVNGVSPGLVNAAMTERLVHNETALRASLSLSAIKRTAEGNDIARAALFLIDNEQSGYVTGQVLAVDGGMSTVKPLPKA